MQIDKYKIKVYSFTAELEGFLKRDQRTIIQTEVDISSVESVDNNDGTYDEIYRAKVVGATECKQGGLIVKGKSKRTQSQKWRNTLWNINPSEEYYEQIMNKMIANPEEVIQFITTLWK